MMLWLRMCTSCHVQYDQTSAEVCITLYFRYLVYSLYCHQFMVTVPFIDATATTQTHASDPHIDPLITAQNAYSNRMTASRRTHVCGSREEDSAEALEPRGCY